ncbi:MAG: Holliday junction resolvase RuvX [Candidatus Borkfalkiaceae bacterium]|nr:Holliday junction resolvase RuvX [Clostridia bacterium]MDY6222676.1 Holliday junction resolvase RuvX [Christensenellaceae bacterium]
MEKKRVVAFDIGEKRIGVAVSDPFGTYAVPCDTYVRTGKFGEDVANTARIAKEKGAVKIVCGLPFNADGTESAQTKRTRRFIEILKKETELPVETEDERYTTLAARETQIQAGIARKDKKKTVDSIAASYILEAYLSKRNQEEIARNGNGFARGGENMKTKETLTAEEEEEHVITLTDDEGNEVEYYHIATLPYKGETYCFFQKAEIETEEDEDEVVIYRLSEDDEGQVLSPLTDDALMDEVFAEFCKEYEAYENSDEAAKLDGAD